jgi:hypothetical protein
MQINNFEREILIRRNIIKKSDICLEIKKKILSDLQDLETWYTNLQLHKKHYRN